MRNFAGPSAGSRNTYAFAAEGSGIFSLNIVNLGEQAAIYELTLQKIVSLDERFRPEEWTDPDPSPRIQELRKQSGFAVEDRIRLFYQGDGILAEALERWRDYISTETLAVAVARGQAPEGASTQTLQIEGHDLQVSVVRVAAR